MQTIKMYIQFIRMEFGNDKCAMFIIQSRKKETKIVSFGKASEPLEKSNITSSWKCWKHKEKRKKIKWKKKILK